MTAVTIRRAGVADAGAVHTMLLELARHEQSAHAVRATEDDWCRMLAEPAVVVLVAYVDDRPAGYVSGLRQLNLWAGREIFAMDDLYVRPGVRDRGIGGRLMAALAEHVADERLLITWGVREDNHAGHRFYRRLGASLRTKMVASWHPRDYTTYLTTDLEKDPCTSDR
ncbi:MAG TPA: GNAT family N-acetyltransferase [Nocardioides sp.]|nr:GNAT family N-acetyltransferase [Nocardioides sp.]